MKYEDYKIEDCYFLNHSEEWDEEEMEEILSTFPETRDNERKIVALEQLIEDVDNGVVKQTRWHVLHPASLKSYAKTHSDTFRYRTETYYKSSGLLIMLGGEEYIINRKGNAQELLDKLRDNQKMIRILSRCYSKKEETFRINKEQSDYKGIHAERIDLGLRTKEKMYGVSLSVCKSVDKSSYRDYYSPNLKRFNGYDYISYNKYGELTTTKGELLTTDTVKELEKACDELAKEISEIIDVYNGRFIDIIRKGKEQN